MTYFYFKDIVTESNKFDLVAFVPLLRERIYSNNQYARQFIISWVRWASFSYMFAFKYFIFSLKLFVFFSTSAYFISISNVNFQNFVWFLCFAFCPLFIFYFISVSENDIEFCFIKNTACVLNTDNSCDFLWWFDSRSTCWSQFLISISWIIYQNF